MLEKPEIPESLIVALIRDEYRLDAIEATFLPLGYDMHTAVYRVSSRAGPAYFCKLRKGDFEPITVELPHFLSQQGMQAVIPPLETCDGRLFTHLFDGGIHYAVILYPYISGQDGYQERLSDQQWLRLGQTMKSIHTIRLPPDLGGKIPHETYNPSWRENAKRFQSMVEEMTYADPVAERLSAFMRSKKLEISHIVQRAEALAGLLSKKSTNLVLCHSDVHPGNFLITPGNELYLVDWDNPIFAPKERDLMFIGAGMSRDLPGGREESIFYRVYGPVEVDLEILAYYRYERIVQDIAEFCAQLLSTSAGGEDRQQAYTYFTDIFMPGGVLEAAIRTDEMLEKNIG